MDSGAFSGLLITGDFNYPKIAWDEDGASTPEPENSSSQMFIDTVQNSALTQHVYFPTFLQANGTSTNTLDLIMTECPHRISEIKSSQPLGAANQGHLTINWNFNLIDSSKSPKFRSSNYAYKRADFVGLSAHFEAIDWKRKFTGKNVEEMQNIFENEYTSGCDKFIPKSNGQQKPKQAPYMTAELKKLNSAKIALWHQNKASGGKVPEISEKLKFARNKFRKALRDKIRKFEEELADDKKNPKRLFNYISNKQSSNDKMKCSAESCNKQFESVFTKATLTNLPAFSTRTEKNSR